MLRRGTRLASCLFILLCGSFFSFSILATRSSPPSTASFTSRVFVFLRNHFDYRILSLSAGFSLAFGFAGLIRAAPQYTSANGVKEAEKKGFSFPTNAEWIFFFSPSFYCKNFLEMLLTVFSELVEIETFNWFSSGFALFLKSQKEKVSVSDRIDCETANKSSCGFSFFNHFPSSRVILYASTAASAPHCHSP